MDDEDLIMNNPIKYKHLNNFYYYQQLPFKFHLISCNFNLNTL